MITTLKIILIFILLVSFFGIIASRDNNERVNLLVMFLATLISIVILQLFIQG